MYSLSWNDGDKSFKAVYPIPISNEDIIFWMLDGILFKKKTGSGPKLSEKADSKSLEKADSKPKFTARVKNFCLRALISNMRIGFSNFSPPKNPNMAFLLQILALLVFRNFAFRQIWEHFF